MTGLDFSRDIHRTFPGTVCLGKMTPQEQKGESSGYIWFACGWQASAETQTSLATAMVSGGRSRRLGGAGSMNEAMIVSH